MPSSRQRRQPARGARVPAVAEAAVETAEAGPQATAVSVSLEGVLWVALAVVATALRFYALDRLPFTGAESARAFAAWAVSEGSVPDGWPGDVTAALTSYLFRIFGASDTAARVIPAIAGSALVASFWYARRYVGRGVALLAAALIALSPLAVYTSRSAYGFALGGVLSMAMVLALLTYIDRPRQTPAVVLAAAAGLALASDPVATATTIAVAIFIAIEAAWRSDGAVSEALSAFRTNRDHWQPAALALAAALVLGVVQFGTDIDRLSLPGLREWLDMFALPRDGLPWHFQFTMLLAYEWPLLLAGAAGYALLVGRWRTAGLSPVQRLLAVWATVAILTVAFATRREAGQLLIVVLPFSLIAAWLVQEVVSKTEWGVLKNWWPALALVLALGAYVALQLSNWSSADAANPFTGRDKAYAWLAFFAAGGSIAVGMSYLQRNAAALALPVAAALAVPFLVHSSLSLGLRDGAEFAAGERATTAVAPLRAAVAAVAAEAGRPATIDAALSDTLGWHLRDLGVALGDPEAGSLFVTVAGRPPPAGYEPLGGPWRISEGWTLDDFGPIRTWRWFVYRRGFGSLSAVDAQILVPTQ